jgi:hypothetical protein
VIARVVKDVVGIVKNDVVYHFQFGFGPNSVKSVAATGNED